MTIQLTTIIRFYYEIYNVNTRTLKNEKKNSTYKLGSQFSVLRDHRFIFR